jgi:transposase
LDDLLMLTPAPMRRIEPYFPRSHGVPRVDDRRVLSGILFVIRNGLRWRDAPPATVLEKPSTTASYAGAGLGCSTAFWPNWPRAVATPTG